MSWNYKAPWETEELPDNYVWERLRLERNALLAACDFRVLPDAPGNVDAWKVYRQSLRDITENLSDPRDVVWPESPSE